jgi:hypothetical protein
MTESTDNPAAIGVRARRRTRRVSRTALPHIVPLAELKGDRAAALRAPRHLRTNAG